MAGRRAQTRFTDGPDLLAASRIGGVDQIVYRLYGLREEEIDVIE